MSESGVGGSVIKDKKLLEIKIFKVKNFKGFIR